MRTTRPFVPTSMSALESRLVLSVMAPSAGAQAAEVRHAPVHLSSAEVAQSNASEAAFGLGTTATLRSGTAVAEQRTTSYSDGSTQTDSLLTVPNLANNTTTTYETISLRHNGGTEKIVDTESFSGGVLPFSGNNNTHNLTVTLPNGSTETETYNEVIAGRKTTVVGTIHEADGDVETWTSVKTRTGPTTTTNKTITEPDGTVGQQKVVTTRQGDLDSSTTVTTRVPAEDSFTRVSYATDVTRTQPPST